MKKILNKLVVLLFIGLGFAQIGFSQELSTEELSYGVHRVYPYLFITKEKLKDAKTLTDLDAKYKSSWVREYISVEVSALKNGEIKTISGQNDTLNLAQKDLMNAADLNTDISVKVRYIPENNLRQNDPQQIDFSFSVDPEQEAKYTEGQKVLKKYLKEKIIDKVPEGTFKRYQLSAVKFTINEEGNIINPHVFWTSENEEIDALLMNTVRDMNCWKAAEYASGLRVKQEFVLTIGDMKSCVVNLINIDPDRFPAE